MLSERPPGLTCSAVRMEIGRVEMVRQGHVGRHRIGIRRQVVDELDAENIARPRPQGRTREIALIGPERQPIAADVLVGVSDPQVGSQLPVHRAPDLRFDQQRVLVERRPRNAAAAAAWPAMSIAASPAASLRMFARPRSPGARTAVPTAAPLRRKRRRVGGRQPCERSASWVSPAEQARVATLRIPRGWSSIRRTASVQLTTQRVKSGANRWLPPARKHPAGLCEGPAFHRRRLPLAQRPVSAKVEPHDDVLVVVAKALAENVHATGMFCPRIDAEAHAD